MIAEQLGMHKATLYHYVRSKYSILYDCLVLSFADLDDVMHCMKDRSLPVLQRLRLFAQSLAAAQNNDFGRCLVLVGARPLTLAPNDRIRQFQRRLDLTVRTLLKEGMADGTVRACEPPVLAALLFGALNWVPHWHRANGRLSVAQVVDQFMDLLGSGIVAGPKRK
jgi:AcrR family transcriptional regulator